MTMHECLSCRQLCVFEQVLLDSFESDEKVNYIKLTLETVCAIRLKAENVNM
jgi:hypothetical protein